MILPQNTLLQSLNSPPPVIITKRLVCLPQRHFFILVGEVGRYLIKKYLPETVTIHREQQADPHFCIPLPLSQLAFLSFAVQILSSCHFKVQCDLGFAPGWCTIKALLGPNKGHTKTAGTSSRLTSCLFFFPLPSNFFIFVTVSPSHSLSVYLLALALSFSPSLLSLIS